MRQAFSQRWRAAALAAAEARPPLRRLSSNSCPRRAPCSTRHPPDPAPNGFFILGLLESATAKVPCASAKGSSAGGTATINGVKITIPADTIVQFPAQTLKWAEVVCPDAGASPIALDGSAGNGGAATLYPSTEFHIQGNIKNAPGAGTEHVAALVVASQLSLNEGSGYISFIDYADGSIYVSTAGGEVELVINDPKGRYGRPQTSLDARFAVDDENPTIKAATGYPMCVPRVAPPLAGSNVETDPLCPQKNRPIARPGASSVAILQLRIPLCRRRRLISLSLWRPRRSRTRFATLLS